MRRIEKVIDIDFDMVTKKDWDNVLIIAGDEGTGKSHLGLHLTEYWNNKLYGACKPEHIKNTALDTEDFVTVLRDINKFEMAVYDEAGDLSNLRQMNKFNYAITQGYRVIRGENLMTVLILPNVFDLNPFFTKRRARGLIQVYKRGRFAFWNKFKLRQIMDYNAHRYRKDVWRVRPLFFDHYPIYKGVLMESYLKKKKAKMKKAREDLYKKVFAEKNKEKERDLLARAKEIVGVKKTAEIFNITMPTVYNRLKN